MSKLKEELVIASKSNIDEYSNINPLYKRVQQIKDTRVLYQPESTTHQIRTITEIIRSKISQTTDNQFWEFKRLLTIQDFEKQSRTFIKTLQEIFVDEHDRINFRREDINLSNLAIRSLIFNPLIINSTLLENLELDEFKVNPNTKKAERVAIYHDLIPIIKEAIIQKVEPINLSNFINENELNYFRLLRINSGKYEGYLIGSQRYGSNKQKGVFHTNIYNANLKTLHIENSYKEEIQLLTKIQYEVDIIHKEISNWSELKQYPERIEELKVSIIECLTNLKHVKNNVKSQLKEALESCVDLKDRKQKYNPGATAAKLIKAKSRLDDRFTEIKRIHGHIGTDKAIITQIIAHQEAPMDKFLNFIKENWKKLKILNQTNPLTKEEKSKIIKNLEIKIRNIQSLIFAPHITFKYAFEHEANILIEMLKNNENNISNETLAIKFLNGM